MKTHQDLFINSVKICEQLKSNFCKKIYEFLFIKAPYICLRFLGKCFPDLSTLLIFRKKFYRSQTKEMQENREKKI